MIAARPLRPYQAHAIELLSQSFREGHRRMVLQLPCGAGKTRIAVEIFRRLLGNSKRGIFVVPRLVLIEQTIRHFGLEGIADVGVIQGDHPRQNPGASVQIASAQTLIRREIPRADVVIVDECHLGFAGITKWIASPEGAGTIFIGLSATPWVRGMSDVWDDLIKPVSIQELIDGGYLSPFRVFVEQAPDLCSAAILKKTSFRPLRTRLC